MAYSHIWAPNLHDRGSLFINEQLIIRYKGSIICIWQLNVPRKNQVWIEKDVIICTIFYTLHKYLYVSLSLTHKIIYISIKIEVHIEDIIRTKSHNTIVNIKYWFLNFHSIWYLCTIAIVSHIKLPKKGDITKMRSYIERMKSSVESQKGIIMLFKDVPLSTRRSLSQYKLYGNSALLLLNRTSLTSAITLQVIRPQQKIYQFIGLEE